MRRVRYQVACSLDGFIAGPAGEFDWIPSDPDIDFRALYDQFDTLLMGSRTFLELQEYIQGNDAFEGKRIVVFSRRLRQRDHPEVRIVGEAAGEVIDDLRRQPGKDIWLYGGGGLFRSLLELGRVDTVEPAIVPVLLGRGRRLLPDSSGPWRLELTGRRSYPKSGTVLLQYLVANGPSGA